MTSFRTMPQTYNHFAPIDEEEVAVKSVSSTWLMSGLTANLEHHIAYSCKKDPQVWYSDIQTHHRPTTDLLIRIQKAMWRAIKVLLKY